jgi:hypothetical protein
MDNDQLSMINQRTVVDKDKTNRIYKIIND